MEVPAGVVVDPNMDGFGTVDDSGATLNKLPPNMLVPAGLLVESTRAGLLGES